MPTIDPSKLSGAVGTALMRHASANPDGTYTISQDALDYYKNLLDAADKLNLGYYGINALSDPITDKAGVTMSRDFMPYENITYDAANPAAWNDQMRFVPAELLTKLYTDKETGKIQSVRELLGNEDIFKNAQLGMLPDALASQLINRDWMGTDYNFTHPNVGYMFNGDMGARLMASGTNPSQWEGAIANDPNFQYQDRDGTMITPFDRMGLGFVSNQGTPADFSGVSIKRITPEVQAALDKINTDWFDAQDQIYGGYLSNATGGVNGPWASYGKNGEWYAVDPNNPSNIMIGQQSNGGIDWTHLPLSLSGAGKDWLSGIKEAVRQNNASQGNGLFENLVSAIAWGGAGMAGADALGFGSGLFDAATSSPSLAGQLSSVETTPPIASGTGSSTGALPVDQVSAATTGTASGGSNVGLLDSFLETLGIPQETTGWIDPLGGAGDVVASTAGSGGATTGAYPWLDSAGNLDVDKFLQMTAPGGEFANTIPGGAAGIPGMDTLGSTTWLESAFNTLKGAGLSPTDALKAARALLSGSSSASGGLGGALQSLGTNGQTIGALGSSLLGYLGSKAQTDALKEQSDKYSAMGAPYREKLANLYADPSSFLKTPGVTASVDQGTNALMRSLSTQGNPFGSGNALQQGQNYATNNLWGQLDTEKKNLANFGGLSSFNAAAPVAGTNAIASGAGGYNAIGAGIGNIFNPPQTAAQQMTALQRAMQGYSGLGN